MKALSRDSWPGQGRQDLKDKKKRKQEEGTTQQDPKQESRSDVGLALHIYPMMARSSQGL